MAALPCHPELKPPATDYWGMEHVENNRFAAIDPARAHLEAGLREHFSQCDAPMPARMERLLQELDTALTERPAVKA